MGAASKLGFISCIVPYNICQQTIHGGFECIQKTSNFASRLYWTSRATKRHPTSPEAKPVSQERRQGHSRSKVRVIGLIWAWTFCLSTPKDYGHAVAMSDQESSWPSFDLFRIIRVKGRAGYWIHGVEFLLLSIGNYGSISHRLSTISNFPIVTSSRSFKVKG